MNREKGLAYCGLACCVCGENEQEKGFLVDTCLSVQDRYSGHIKVRLIKISNESRVNLPKKICVTQRL